MKFILLLATLTILVASCQVQAQTDPAYTGQPGCLSEEELTVALYPHFRNKRAYWRCSVLGEPAVLELCPIAQAYLAPAQSCVVWAEWYWTPTVAPPSVPAIQEAAP